VENQQKSHTSAAFQMRTPKQDRLRLISNRFGRVVGSTSFPLNLIGAQRTSALPVRISNKRFHRDPLSGCRRADVAIPAPFQDESGPVPRRRTSSSYTVTRDKSSESLPQGVLRHWQAVNPITTCPASEGGGGPGRRVQRPRRRNLPCLVD
jgi:hypothetical protein